MFGSLHTRSHFSFLQGASSPDELVQRAATLHHDYVALTDVHGVYGAVHLQRACLSAGLRPLIGSEVTVDAAPIVFLTQSMEGYASLCKLLTTAHQRSRLEPHVALHELQALTHDVVVLTGGREGRAWQLAAARRDTDLRSWLYGLNTHMPGRVFVELIHHRRPHDGTVAHTLYTAARALELPTVIGTDARYAAHDDYATYDALMCAHQGITVFDHHADRPVNDEQCLRSYQDLHKLLPYDDAFATTSELASRCTFDVLPNHITPPLAQLPQGMTATATLRTSVEEAFIRRYANTMLSRAARRQLEHELDVICTLGLQDFFLVVKEVTDEAKRRGIRCSGRGSAANSIVAYLLGITGVCPLQHHLLFERFLHRGRKGTPDIDVDFDSERREEVIAWMEQRFGMEQTAMTATIITYRTRMAVRDAAKVLGWPIDTVNALSKSVPGFTNKDLGEFRDNIVRAAGEAPLINVLTRIVRMIEGRPRHLGLHSGGMILSQRPLWQLTPVQVSANGVKVVQFDKDDVEAMGLIKLDVLGLRMLACIAEAVEHVELREGCVVDIDEVPLDDPEIYQLIKDGKTLGVFQIESQGQMHLLAQHQPEVFDDLVTEVALFRPGPLQGGMVNPYVRRRRGHEAVTYAHPDLEPILRDTLGIILFQEQVLEIAHRFAGMSLDDADDFRSIVSKNRDVTAMEAMRVAFIAGAVARGVDRTSAEEVHEKVSHFVGYGFCRSHAAAFAKIVYQSAWLKRYHPACYMAAFMQHRPGFYNLMTLEEEARRCGVQVLGPDVHTSGIRYDVHRQPDGKLAIQKPITSVANCSDETARIIIWARAERAFTSVEDLWLRAPVPADALDSLALSGALDTLAGSSRKALWELGVIKRRGLHLLVQPAIFERPLVMPEDVPPLPPLKAQERLAYDYMTHGAARIHPMTLYRRILTSLEVRAVDTCMRIAPPDAQVVKGHRKNDTGVDVTIAGIVILRQSPPTAHGVLFVTIEDETGFVQCVIQPEERERFSEELRHAALIVRGRVHAVQQWRGLLVRNVHILSNVIGGYHGHPAMYGGTDSMELTMTNSHTTPSS